MADSKPYKITLRKGSEDAPLQGSRRRVVHFAAGPATFNADQDDPGRPDYPTKILALSESEAEQYAANADFEVSEASSADAEASMGARKKASKDRKARLKDQQAADAGQ